MKTLDEVIKDLEKCMSDDAIESEGFYLATDSLFYLREYRNKMINDEEAYKRGYSCGYAKAREDEAVSRSWDESYRASQMPWNHGCEMGG